MLKSTVKSAKMGVKVDRGEYTRHWLLSSFFNSLSDYVYTTNQNQNPSDGRQAVSLRVKCVFVSTMIFPRASRVQSGILLIMTQNEVSKEGKIGSS